MRNTPFMTIVLVLFMVSCKKDHPYRNIPAGTYKGTFQRSLINQVSNVTLEFSSDGFEGQSQYLHYPDICHGKFSTSQDTVLFENACVYTADFDWSYILSGKFKISLVGDSLIMKKEYNGVVYYYDIYKLKKQ